ncbi:hypothetical protein BGZ54_004802 [Gamsiella multidivaricata]|nr:hypothetical protein BGZ54_004802 [Gamsiella multidivaricata]
MQTNPPFFPYGQKRAAWEAVASLARSNPDLLHVNGTLCEGRYKQVRDEYKAAQAAARRATGTAEPAPSEQDMILENLIRLEEDVEKREEEEKQRQAAQTADENQLQATALDIRDAAVRFVAQDTDPATESVHTKNVIDELPTPKRRKRRFDGDKAEFDKTNQLLQQALLKYLNK